MLTLGTIVIAGIAIVGAATGASPPEPCSQVTAPPIVIDTTLEGPVDIALAWHAPTSDAMALDPPIEAHGMICDGTKVKGPRPNQSGDRVTRGAITNTGESTISILTTDGEIITLPPGRSLWIGDTDSLGLTHHCICECQCDAGSASHTIVFACEGNGGCAINGTLCEIWVGGRPLTGGITGCRKIYTPLPPPSPGPGSNDPPL